MSLTITVNSEPLELSENFSLNTLMACPIFDKDSVARAFTFPFRIPKSPGNVSRLGNINRFDARANQALFQDTRILLDGATLYVGELVATGSDEDNLEVMFRTKAIGILEDAAKVKINTLLETITSIGNTGTGGYWLYEFAQYPATFSISFDKPGAIATYTPNVGVTSDIASLIFASQINNLIPGIVVGAGGGQIRLSSKLIAQYAVIQTVVLDFVSYVSEGQHDQAAMTAFVNDVVVNDDDERLTFPMVRWVDAYGGKVPAFNFTVNPVVDGELVQNIAYDIDSNWIRTVIPFVRWRYVMAKIAAKLGIVFAGPIWEETDIQRLILVNNYTLDHVCADREPVPGNISSTYLKYLNGYEQVINLNDHVPDMTAADFILAFANTFGLWIELAKNTVIFHSKRDLVIQKPVDWSAWVSPSDYSDVITEDDGFTLDYTRRKEEQYVHPIPGQLEAYVSGMGKDLLNIPTSTLYEDNTATDGTGGLVRIPHTKQKLESPYLGGKPGQYPLQFLFYRGLQLSEEGHTYPYATNDDKSRTGAVIGTRSLDWHGTQGLYAKSWKGIAGLDNKRALRIKATVPISEIMRLSQWDNALISFFHKNGSVVAVIRDIQFIHQAVSTSGFVDVQVRCVIK